MCAGVDIDVMNDGGCAAQRRFLMNKRCPKTADDVQELGALVIGELGIN